MNAKRDDFSSIQEIYDVIVQTKEQIERLAFTRDRFVYPSNDADDLMAEGIANRVFRVSDEVAHVCDETAAECGFDRKAVSGLRNRLAHAYGEVDRDILWQVIENDFDDLLEACGAFCERRGVEL